MWTNYILLVLGEIKRFGWTFLRVDVEVIKPEIRHHFLELAIACYSASDSRRLKLYHNLAAAECDALLHRDVTLSRARRSITGLSLSEASLSLAFSVCAKEIVLILLENAVLVQEVLKVLVVDTLGMKLLINPFVETDRANLLSIARTSAEREAIERVNYLLVCRELAMVEARLTGGCACY